MSTTELYGSFFIGGAGASFALSGGASAASSERGRPSLLTRCGTALRCPALAAALDARCAAPFRARFPEAAALLATLPDVAHAALARDFFSVHLGIFISATLVAAAIVGALARISYLNAWVLCTGAMTGGSLSPVDMALVPTGAQVVLWLLMACGGITFTALWPLGYRLYIFRARLKPALRRARRMGPELRRASRPRLPQAPSEDRAVALGEADVASTPQQPTTASGAPARGTPESAAVVLAALEAADTDPLLAELSAQDEGLAAVAAVTVAYTVFWTLVVMGALWRRAVLLPHDAPLPAALAARGLRPGWYALFFSTSALNNVGLSLFSSSAGPMANDAPTLLALAAASLAGNTAWPPALRFLLRIGERGALRLSARVGVGARRDGVLGAAVRGTAAFARGCRYALEHPQTCYHLLFPPRETAALLAALFLTNAVQLAVFGGSTARLPALLAAVPSGRDRAAVAFFTAVNSRSTGFTAVDLNDMAPVMVVVIAFMMWFSPYPLVALWARDDVDGGADLFAASGKKNAAQRFPVVQAFNKRYIKRHATWLTLATITLAAAEAPLLAMPSQNGSGKSPTSLFALIFEILSAYGTNGMSLGWPGAPFNLCGMFHPISKLVIVALMFLGRHRSMPRQVDPPLAGRVAAAEELAAAAKAELAAWAAARQHGSGVTAASASMLARVGSFTQDSITAALALIRNTSSETLAAMASGTRQQRAAAVEAAMSRQRAGLSVHMHTPMAPLPPIPQTPRTPLPTMPEAGFGMDPDDSSRGAALTEQLQESELELKDGTAAADDAELRHPGDGNV